MSGGSQISDPNDPTGKLFFNILATFAEFEVDLTSPGVERRSQTGIAIRTRGLRHAPASAVLSKVGVSTVSRAASPRRRR